MTFQFKFHKSPDAPQEEFTSAISCAKNCIESTLNENNPTVTVSGDSIFIDVANMTMQQCKKQIQGCFCDSSGQTYLEFRFVEPTEQ